MFGLVEATFNCRESQLTYRIGKDDKVHGFFIRLRNWKNILNTLSQSQILVEKFKKHILKDYIKKILLPIESHQNDILTEEKQKKALRDAQKKVALETEMRR